MRAVSSIPVLYAADSGGAVRRKKWRICLLTDSAQSLPSHMWDWMCLAPGQYLLIRQEADMQKAKDGQCYSRLNIRAIHIEMIESLNTSSFINALRRFLAIRGPVKQIRSDRGTNFIGACKDLQIPSNVDEKVLKQFLFQSRLYMDIQSSAFVAHGRCVGKDDWAYPQELGFYASSDDILQTHARSTHHLYS